MGLSFQAARILERLHNAIQTQGQRSLDGIRARQHDLAQNEKREVTEKDFVAATAGDGVIAGEEAGALFRELAGGGERMPFAAVHHLYFSVVVLYERFSYSRPGLMCEGIELEMSTTSINLGPLETQPAFYKLNPLQKSKLISQKLLK